VDRGVLAWSCSERAPARVRSPAVRRGIGEHRISDQFRSGQVALDRLLPDALTAQVTRARRPSCPVLIECAGAEMHRSADPASTT
jgi:hypothetical protein